MSNLPAAQRLPWKVVDQIINHTVDVRQQPMCLQADASTRTNANPYQPFLGVCHEWRAATQKFVHELEANNNADENETSAPQISRMPNLLQNPSRPALSHGNRSISKMPSNHY
ncbi:hypothetical protein H4S02_005253 [Coemansia sp. RSA 2611]|nr:hypothetical protein H4S02_005253 [Coemansia sp. RSA 2611]